MFVNSMTRYTILSDEAMDVLDRGRRRIVSERGVDFMLALEAYEPPPIDEAVRAQLQEFVARRGKELGD